MTYTKRRPAVLALAGACALAAALAGCSKPAPKTDTATSTTSTSVTTTTASTGATSGLPSECNAYFDKVTTCMNKMGASNPAMAAQFKASMDQARAQYAAMQDKTALANVCKQSNAAFAQNPMAANC